MDKEEREIIKFEKVWQELPNRKKYLVPIPVADYIEELKQENEELKPFKAMYWEMVEYNNQLKEENERHKQNDKLQMERAIKAEARVKELEGIEHNYCLVLCHATNSRMSKSCYDINTIYSEIDDAQSKDYYGIVKDDLNKLIEQKGTIEDVKKYIDSLI